jgi:hypothetical protein
MYNTNTQAYKMQLKQELQNKKTNINDHSINMKKLTDVFAFIGAPLINEDLVAMILMQLNWWRPKH